MDPKIEVVKNLSDLLRKFSSLNIPVLLLLSGGSNLNYLDQIPKDVFSNKLTITTLDERYTLDKHKSNMAQIKAIDGFYKKVLSSNCRLIDTTVQDNENIDKMATRINDELINWLDKNPDGQIVITAGVGSDGHISGMKPLEENLFTKLFMDTNSNRLVVGYDASDVDPENPKRVTTTINFFRKINKRAHIIVYAINKSEALERLSAPNGKLNETPARILREMNDVRYFTDIQDFKLKYTDAQK